MLPQVELVALVEYDDKSRVEIKQIFGCKVYKEYTDLLEDRDIDLVSIES